MQEPQGWMNGAVCTFSQMHVPAWDLGVVAGASITEMARTFQHRPFRLPQHLHRLLSSCAEIGFETPYSAGDMLAAAEALVAGNVSLIDANADLGIVMFVTAGANRTYLGDGDLPGPTVGIHTFPLPFSVWKTAIRDGVRLQIPQRHQIQTDCLPVHLKTRNRLHWWLADREAHAIESGSRALLTDSDGYLTETSTACFYAVIDNEIITPERNVLHSLSRNMVQAAADAAGLAFRTGDLHIDDIPRMQQAFVSSTPVGVLPVKSIGGVQFDVQLEADAKESVLPAIRDYWKQQTGIDPAQQILAQCR